MKKKMLLVLALLFLIPGLLFFTSCGKQTVKSDFGEVKDESEKEMASEVSSTGIDTETVPDEHALIKRAGPSIEEQTASEKNRAMQMFVNEDVLFEFDSAVLTNDAKKILKKKAAYLEKYPGVSTTIEGHCDERGTNEYNLALGERRAQSAKNFLINLGIASSRLKTISYGEEKPIDPGRNETAWAKNRRAHFITEPQ